MKGEGVTNTRRHAKLDRAISEFATLYNRAGRTVKRWIRMGKDSGDPPPLGSTDDRFIGWYEKHVGPAPQDLLTICSEAGTATVDETDDVGLTRLVERQDDRGALLSLPTRNRRQRVAFLARVP